MLSFHKELAAKLKVLEQKVGSHDHDPRKTQSFCQSIQLDTDFEEMAERPNMRLETRTRAPETGSDISNRASNTCTVDGFRQDHL